MQELFVQQKFLSIPFHAPMTNQYLFIPKFDTAGCECGLKILPRRKSADAAFVTVKKSIEKRGSVDRIQPALREVIGAYEMRQLQCGAWTMQFRNRQAVS